MGGLNIFWGQILKNQLSTFKFYLLLISKKYFFDFSQINSEVVLSFKVTQIKKHPYLVTFSADLFAALLAPVFHPGSTAVADHVDMPIGTRVELSGFNASGRQSNLHVEQIILRHGGKVSTLEDVRRQNQVP